jgi:uncharacterized caspase-like protein
MLRTAVIVLLFALLPSQARAEARMALLIGNEAYGSEIGRLANPHNDVALLEHALKGLRFEVVVVHDAGLGALTRAVNAYARRLQAAGSSSIGFFYYSGHGASDGSTNYLIPIDVKTTETGELWDQSLRLTEITRKLKAEAANAVHFVVFDACRNTLKLAQPGSRAVVQAKGFVPVAQENGMLIAYATAEGELASDAGAGAGPYAKVLAEEIVKSGVEAVAMFRIVQRRVRSAVRQEPYLGFSALGDVYLAGKGDLPDTVAAQQSGWNTAEREWQQYGKDTKDIRLLEAFKEKHKADPIYVRLAEARIDELKGVASTRLPAQGTAKPDVASATPEQMPLSRSTKPSEKILLAHHSSWGPGCKHRGVPRVTVKTPPEHGQVVLQKEMYRDPVRNFGTRACQGTTQYGVGIYYVMKEDVLNVPDTDLFVISVDYWDSLPKPHANTWSYSVDIKRRTGTRKRLD